jgi:hypothetical protein
MMGLRPANPRSALFYFLFFTCRFSSRALSAGLFLLRTILATALLAIFDPCCIQTAADDVITHTRKVLYTTTADQHDGVLLQIMPLTRNIRNHLDFIGQPHLRYFTQSGVGFLRRSRVYTGANATTLRTSIQSPGFALCTDDLSSFSN